MKVKIEITEGLAEDEVVIHCATVDDKVQRLHQLIVEQSATAARLVFYKENQEFFFPLEEVLFFETEGEAVYAHTKNDAYRIRYRLYELEQLLPPFFIRAAKSSIVNARRIHSITRNLTSASLVQFADTHKQVYVSRRYYGALRERMDELRQRGVV